MYMFNISYEIIFSTVGVLSFIGWGALVFSPLRPAPLTLAARIISIVLALIYTYLLVSLWGHETKVDFSSLEGVADGFSYMGHLLTGWIHFLALDLFLGAWQVERARKIGIPHIILLPCLMLTFLVGPLGLLLFLMIEAIKMRSIKKAEKPAQLVF
jgi:hypothetical protein